IIDPMPPYFGLDISELSVKVLQMAHHGKYDSVHGFASEKLGMETIKDGDIKNVDGVVDAIKRARKKARISAKNVICSLPESKSFVRIVTIPQMKDEEIAEAIKWEIEAAIPLSIDQVYYDWQALDRRLTKDEKQMDVIVAAVSKKFINNLIRLLKRANLTVYGFEIESVAQANSLLRDDEKGITTMIIDIGDKSTSFVITVDNIPVFTSNIPLSAESMTKTIEQTFGITYKEAENIKITYGIGSVLKNDHVFQAAESVVENFVVEAQKSIDFYLTGLTYSDTIDRIIICGGGAKTIGLAPYLSRRLGHNIELGNPWVNMNFKGVPPMDRGASVQYATVIGLASKKL
ncbi:MAG: type IV pilus assembly protein PilM, partial [Patescibacteria group bacterium]|nr:type IV pilus assembly protein PilM [Patescibacteria group bacterium]